MLDGFLLSEEGTAVAAATDPLTLILSPLGGDGRGEGDQAVPYLWQHEMKWLIFSSGAARGIWHPGATA